MAPGFSMYDQWEAQLLALILLKARVGLFSEIPADEVRRGAPRAGGGPQPARRPTSWRGAAPDAPVAVLPEGPMTIPYLGQAEPRLDAAGRGSVDCRVPASGILLAERTPM